MKNANKTSVKVAKLAGQTLNDDHASATAKKLAASVLSQAVTGRQTGSEMEDIASKVLQSDKYSDNTKTLAGSVLSQSNKDR